MPYLICDKCDVYYELQEGAPEDYEVCECGNKLKYYDSLDSYLKSHADNPDIQKDEGFITQTYKKPNRNIIIGIAAFFLVVFLIAGFMGFFSPINHYEDHGFSFDYPKSWKVIHEGEDYGAVEMIMINPEYIASLGILKVKPGFSSISLEEAYNRTLQDKPPNLNVISNKTTMMSGTIAYELDFEENTSEGVLKGKAVLFEKNGSYFIIFIAPKELFGEVQRDFYMIKNSFRAE